MCRYCATRYRLRRETMKARRVALLIPRPEDVRSQFARPAFSRVAELDLRFLRYSELRQHRSQMARFGSGLKAVQAVAKPLRPAASR